MTLALKKAALIEVPPVGEPEAGDKSFTLFVFVYVYEHDESRRHPLKAGTYFLDMMFFFMMKACSFDR